MGGDLCHHGGELRPSPQYPLPSELSLHHPRQGHSTRPCPGAFAFAELQHKRSRTTSQPFFDLAMGYDVPEGTRTIHKVQEFDADEHVFFISAHDDALHDLVDFFPPADANDWKIKGWGDQARWAFLKDFESGITDK